jgi:hypothetical protein
MSAARAEAWNELMTARRALARQVELAGDLDQHLPDLLTFLTRVPMEFQATPLRYLRESLDRKDLHADPARPTIHLLPRLLAYMVIVLGWIPNGYTLPRLAGPRSGPQGGASGRARRRVQSSSIIATGGSSSSPSSRPSRRRSAGDEAR